MGSSENGHGNGLYTYDSFSGNKKKQNRHFLWWCAGAHQQLLKDFPSEHTKYAGLGAVLLGTFALASLAAGYAIYTVFNSVSWAIAFGILWGLIIFNFDRFLVSTMRKYGQSSARQFTTALPRIILALLIGITIARPLEMKVFEKEIDTKVAENRHKKIQINDSLVNAESKLAADNATNERNRLMARKISIEDSLHRLQQAYVTEADGTGGSMQRGIENITRLKQNAYQLALEQFKPELKKLSADINVQDSILNSSRAGVQAKRKEYESMIASNVGFLERNKALSDLSGEEPSVFWATIFISLLIIVIEAGPVLSKMIMHSGPYDIELAKTELMQMAASENEMRKDKQLNTEKLAEWLKMKKQHSSELMQKISALQKKHIDAEIDRWDRGEKNPVNRPPINDLMNRIRENYDYEDQQLR